MHGLRPMGMPNYRGCSNNYVPKGEEKSVKSIQIPGSEVIFIPPQVVSQLVQIGDSHLI